MFNGGVIRRGRDGDGGAEGFRQEDHRSERTDTGDDEAERERRELRTSRIDRGRELKANTKVLEEFDELDQLPVLGIRVLGKSSELLKHLADLKTRLTLLHDQRRRLVEETLEVEAGRDEERDQATEHLRADANPRDDIVDGPEVVEELETLKAQTECRSKDELEVVDLHEEWVDAVGLAVGGEVEGVCDE